MATEVPGSFIYDVIERVRFYMEGHEDDKYSDDVLLKNTIMPAYAQVWSDIQQSAEDIITLQYDLTLAADTEFHALPPTIAEVMGVCKVSTTGNNRIEYDWIPSDVQAAVRPDPCRVAWTIEGNHLRFRPKLASAETNWMLLYVPSSDLRLHYGTATFSVDNGDYISATLDSTPTVGQLDKRINAYAGQFIRIFDTNVWHEILIESYDPSTREATFRLPIPTADLGGGEGGLPYEIAPLGHASLVEAIGVQAAMSMGVARRVSRQMMESMDIKYDRAMRNLHQLFANKNVRLPKHFRKVSKDHEIFKQMGREWGGR